MGRWCESMIIHVGDENDPNIWVWQQWGIVVNVRKHEPMSSHAGTEGSSVNGRGNISMMKDIPNSTDQSCASSRGNTWSASDFQHDWALNARRRVQRTFMVPTDTPDILGCRLWTVVCIHVSKVMERFIEFLRKRSKAVISRGMSNVKTMNWP